MTEKEQDNHLKDYNEVINSLEFREYISYENYEKLCKLYRFDITYGGSNINIVVCK